MEPNDSNHATSRKELGLSQPLIPDHVLLRPIGHGSYGEVWLARNTLGTYRAVKVVRLENFRERRPFEREWAGIRSFEPISRSHDAFVDVLHVGMNEEQAYFYYVMELGDDAKRVQEIDPDDYAPKTLAREISAKRNLPFADCLQLALTLSDALAQMHSRGLVHRDVKPANIIYINGVPKLADIGLVAELDEAFSYVGTTGFIPPEGPGTTQADVYGLGKLLYEAATGMDRNAFPILPDLWDQLPDHSKFLELNEVILHACEKDPKARYQSAEEMHSELMLLASGKSLKRLRLLERRLSAIKRVAAISGLVVLVLAVVSAQVYREWKHTIESRQRDVGAAVAYGNRAIESGDLLGALPYFVDALNLDQRNFERQLAQRLRFGSALAQCPKLIRVCSVSDRVNFATLSPDGNSFLIAENLGKARIYRIDTGELFLRPFGPASGLRRASFSPDGRLILTASEDRTAALWDAHTLQLVRIFPHPKRVYDARFNSDGRRIVTACEDGVSRVWDTGTGELQFELHEHTDAILCVCFNTQGDLILTASRDGTARMWNASTGKRVGPVLPHSSWVNYAAFSPDSERIVTACADHIARVWDVETGKKIPPELIHRDMVMSAEFSPDGSLILTASTDGTARLWQANDLRPLPSNPILRHGDRVLHASFDRDSHRIITAGVDGTVRIWDLAGITVQPEPLQGVFSEDRTRYLTFTSNELHVWGTRSRLPISKAANPGFGILTANLSCDGRFILLQSKITETTNASERVLHVLQTETGTPVGPPIPLGSGSAHYAISRDGKCLVIMNERTAQTWSVSSGTMLARQMVHDHPINSAAFDPAGHVIATWDGGTVKVWEAASGRELFAPLSHALPIYHVEFSPDGTRLVTCDADPSLAKCYAQVWSAANGSPIGPRLYHHDGVLYAAFSPDGTRLVTASEDFTAIIWDFAKGVPLAPALQHEHQVNMAAFKTDGRWIVTASPDRTVRVWNAEDGEPLTPPLRHLQKPKDAIFLPDGLTLVTSDQKGTSWMWKLPADQRPVDYLTRLARFLSGDTSKIWSPRNPSYQIQPQRVWEQLRAHYPSDFIVSPTELIAWHDFQAQQSEALGEWITAVFHLERLARLAPNSPAVLERLNWARRKLGTAN